MCASTLIGLRADETASDFSDRRRSKLNDLCVVKNTAAECSQKSHSSSPFLSCTCTATAPRSIGFVIVRASRSYTTNVNTIEPRDGPGNTSNKLPPLQQGQLVNVEILSNVRY